MDEALKINCRHCHAKLDLSDCPPFEKVRCPECGATLTVPMRFERYLLEKVCGKGGDSIVYRALEPELARRVAVKIEVGAGDEEAAQRFINSARISGRLLHPAVVPIYNCGTFEGRAFQVLRYMEHGDLEQMMKCGALPEGEKIISWITAIIPALIEARNSNIIHHDIKPANILLTAEDEPKLGDWDVAELRDEAGQAPDRSCWASPIYASPERIFSGSEDHKGDIFSLGVTLYELLSGMAPFGLHGNEETIYERRQNMEFRPLAALIPGVPPVVSMTVTAMLEFRPENRPDYEEILAVLKSTLSSGNIS